MRLGRLRSGEIIAAIGAVAVLVSLGLNWFELRSPVATVGQHESGVRSLGWLAVLIIGGAALLALAYVATTATRTSPTLPVALQVVGTTLAFLAVLVVVIRMLFRPTLGVEGGGADLAWGALAGLVSTLVMAYGMGRAMADERTDSRDSRRQTERVLAVRGEPRPAPPREASRA
jgi:drug/metabolite transporter (DMT)-like permease